MSRYYDMSDEALAQRKWAGKSSSLARRLKRERERIEAEKAADPIPGQLAAMAARLTAVEAAVADLTRRLADHERLADLHTQSLEKMLAAIVKPDPTPAPRPAAPPTAPSAPARPAAPPPAPAPSPMRYAYCARPGDEPAQPGQAPVYVMSGFKSPGRKRGRP